MKQKFALITLLLIALVQLNSYAQGPKNSMLASLPLVAEDGISSLTVSDNVSVVLIQDRPENIGVKADDNALRKLSVSLVNGNLFLSAAKTLADDERLTVYVWVNDLQNLTLKGNAFVVSRGILQSSNLYISAAKETMVSVKSKGKVWFEAPANYQVLKETGNFTANGF